MSATPSFSRRPAADGFRPGGCDGKSVARRRETSLSTSTKPGDRVMICMDGTDKTYPPRSAHLLTHVYTVLRIHQGEILTEFGWMRSWIRARNFSPVNLQR